MARELTYKDCRNSCPEVQFNCQSTQELTPLTEIIGQDRAARALQFGLRIQTPGFTLDRKTWLQKDRLSAWTGG